jgi:hypothetical protein
MDIQPQSTKPISDDQELAKVLAGVTGNMSFEETPKPAVAQAKPADQPAPIVMNREEQQQPVPQPMPQPTPKAEPFAPKMDSDVTNLDGIKQEALIELRPLLDKLNIAPEEKFDIYLLLLRSTDDRTLIAPAHICAQGIVDETRRAQALLDIIKEIDFLSAPTQQHAI